MAEEFLTLPDDAKSDLQGLANAALVALRQRGYSVKIEPVELELPGTPTLVAKRRGETNFFLVRHTIAKDEVEHWVRYAQSCTRDTRVTICHGSKPPSAASIQMLRTCGVALIVRAERGNLMTLAEGRDLAFHAVAPDRRRMKPKVRRLLAVALDRLENGDWRIAFEEACIALEEQCRAYLVVRRKLNRVQYQQGGKVKIPTQKDIERMPLGAIKDVFCRMVSQNHVEANLCSALTKINPDRIQLAHKRSSSKAEQALRRRVGTHFWLINNALSLIV